MVVAVYLSDVFYVCSGVWVCGGFSFQEAALRGEVDGRQ